MPTIAVFFNSMRWEKKKPWKFKDANQSYELFSKTAEQFGLKAIFSDPKHYRKGIVTRAWAYHSGWKIVKNEKIDFAMFQIFNTKKHIKFRRNLERNNVMTLNRPEFELLVQDKYAIHKLFKHFRKRTFLVNSRNDVLKKLKYTRTDKIVLKPRYGSEGRGIYIVNRSKIPEISRDYIMEEFIDSSKGIKNIVSSVFDLRIISLNGKIVYQYIRVPRRGLISNVARGGRVIPLKREQIPRKAIKVFKEIEKKLKKRFKRRFYSTDLGIDKDGNVYLFEINSHTGLYISKSEPIEEYIKIYEKLFSYFKSNS